MYFDYPLYRQTAIIALDINVGQKDEQGAQDEYGNRRVSEKERERYDV